MRHTKQTFMTAFALFSLFFGAGNLILPPFLGFQASSEWIWVTFGFAISAVIIPILAIYGHARLQGTLTDFAKKISPSIALVYAVAIYLIAISLPSPRTASVTYEMAIAPYFELSSLWFSCLYFALVLLFALNRSKILELIGKFLTPILVILLVIIIAIGLFAEHSAYSISQSVSPFTEGILEGYQTFDAIGGVVVGGVIVVSFALQGKYGYEEKKKMIGKAGLYAGFGLFTIYAGLIAIGAFYSGMFTGETRTELLTYLGIETLGNVGTSFLAVAVGLACFTTAVGIVTGTADFFKGILGNSRLVYSVTAVLGCAIGIAVGQFNVAYIIDIALPALMIIYPLTIILILLNAIPQQFASPLVFRIVALITVLFSLPDFLGFIVESEALTSIRNTIPLGNQNMGWVLPAFLAFILANLLHRTKKAP
nr:branched-chain amino acid transport system II carrier protein [Luteirhabdus pelagi]